MAHPEPIFRAPKGTANFNAFRTLQMGVVCALAIMLATEPMLRLWDMTRAVPWVQARIELRPARSPYGVIVVDSVRAAHPVSGERRVWVETPEGHRICDAERHDSWAGTSGRTWSFRAFTEAGCDLPAAPFRVCSSFIVETASGLRGSFGPDCSGLFDPRAR